MKKTDTNTNELGDMRVFVYWNLHKRAYSIRCMRTKRVVAIEDSVVLYNAMPKVSEAGRQRVLREQRKNVHAGVVGWWHRQPTKAPTVTDMQPITYNPYKWAHFVELGTERKIDGIYSLCYMTHENHKTRVYVQANA